MTIAAFALPAVPADAATTCRSGFPYVEHDGVRIFEVDRRDRPYVYACTRKIRRPRLVYARSPATDGAVYQLGRRGSRVLLEVYESADGGGGSALGWFDVRTGRAVFRELDNIGDADFGQSVLHATLGKDGSIAYARDTVYDPEIALEEDGIRNEHALFYLRYRKGRFDREKRLAKVGPAELDPRTIAFAEDSVTWRAVGAERTLAIPSPPQPGPIATPLAPRRTYPGNCKTDAGEGLRLSYLTDSLPVRLFRVARGSNRGIWACRADDKTPGRYVMPATRSLALTAATTKVLAFATKPRGGDGGIVGWFEPRAGLSFLVRTATLGGAGTRPRRIVALAPDPARGLVLLDALADGSYAITFLRAFGSGFDSEAQLAPLAPAEIEPHTLTARDGVIRWRTRGEARSAPLGS